MNKSCDKTCIDNTELKIEIMNVAIDRKTDGVAVASLASATLALLAVSNYFDPQVPSSLLQLHHHKNRQRNNSTNFPPRWYLRASSDSFRLLRRAGFTKTKCTFQLRVYLRMPQNVTRRQLPLRCSRVNLAKSND